MFGAVGAYSWSGGIVQDLTRQMLNSSFINATNMEEDIRDSYLGTVSFINWLLLFLNHYLWCAIVHTFNTHIQKKKH